MVECALVVLTLLAWRDCGPGQADLDHLYIDDLIIAFEVAPIDGPGETLARAGPTLIRRWEFIGIPSTGSMTFDSGAGARGHRLVTCLGDACGGCAA